MNPYSRAGCYESAYRALPKWKRELRLLRRDGLRKYVRGALRQNQQRPH